VAFREPDAAPADEEHLLELARVDHHCTELTRLRRVLVTAVAIASLFPCVRALAPSLASRAVELGAELWLTLALVTLCLAVEEWRFARRRRRLVAQLADHTRVRLGL
jgi:hypothetical protein